MESVMGLGKSSISPWRVGDLKHKQTRGSLTIKKKRNMDLTINDMDKNFYGTDLRNVSESIPNCQPGFAVLMIQFSYSSDPNYLLTRW
jgi:hypothetical protein